MSPPLWLSREGHPEEGEANEPSEEEGELGEEGELEDDGEEEDEAEASVDATATGALVAATANDALLPPSSLPGPSIPAVTGAAVYTPGYGDFELSCAATSPSSARSPLLRMYAPSSTALTTPVPSGSQPADGPYFSPAAGYRPPPPPPPPSLLGSAPPGGIPGVLPPPPPRFRYGPSDSAESPGGDTGAADNTAVEDGEEEEEEGAAPEEGEAPDDDEDDGELEEQDSGEGEGEGRFAADDGSAGGTPASCDTRPHSRGAMLPPGTLLSQMPSAQGGSFDEELLSSGAGATGVVLQSPPGLPGLRLPAAALSPTSYAAGPPPSLPPVDGSGSPELHAARPGFPVGSRPSGLTSGIDAPMSNAPPLLAPPAPGIKPQWLDEFPGTTGTSVQPPAPCSAPGPPPPPGAILASSLGSFNSSVLQSAGTGGLTAKSVSPLYVQNTALLHALANQQPSLLGPPPPPPASTSSGTRGGTSTPRSPLLSGATTPSELCDDGTATSEAIPRKTSAAGHGHIMPEPEIPSMVPSPLTKVSSPMIPTAPSPAGGGKIAAGPTRIVPRIVTHTSGTKRKRSSTAAAATAIADLSPSGPTPTSTGGSTSRQSAPKLARVAAASEKRQQHTTTTPSEPPSGRSSAQASSASGTQPSAKRRRGVRLTLSVVPSSAMSAPAGAGSRSVTASTPACVLPSTTTGHSDTTFSPSTINSGVGRRPGRSSRHTSPQVKPEGAVAAGRQRSPAGTTAQLSIRSTTTVASSRPSSPTSCPGPSTGSQSHLGRLGKAAGLSALHRGGKGATRSGASAAPAAAVPETVKPASPAGEPPASEGHREGSPTTGSAGVAFSGDPRLPSETATPVIRPAVIAAIKLESDSCRSSHSDLPTTPSTALSVVAAQPPPTQPELKFAGPYVLAWRSVTSEMTSPALQGEHMTCDTGAPLKFAGVAVPQLDAFTGAPPSGMGLGCVDPFAAASQRQLIAGVHQRSSSAVSRMASVPLHGFVAEQTHRVPGEDMRNLVVATAGLDAMAGDSLEGNSQVEEQQRLLRVEDCLRRQTELLLAMNDIAPDRIDLVTGSPDIDFGLRANPLRTASTAAEDNCPFGIAAPAELARTISMVESEKGSDAAPAACGSMPVTLDGSCMPLPIPPSPTTAASSPGNDEPSRRNRRLNNVTSMKAEAPNSWDSVPLLDFKGYNVILHPDISTNDQCGIKASSSERWCPSRPAAPPIPTPVMVDLEEWKGAGPLDDLQIGPETVSQVAEMLQHQREAVKKAIECLGSTTPASSWARASRKRKRWHNFGDNQLESAIPDATLELPEIVCCHSEDEIFEEATIELDFEASDRAPSVDMGVAAFENCFDLEQHIMPPWQRLVPNRVPSRRHHRYGRRDVSSDFNVVPQSGCSVEIWEDAAIFPGIWFVYTRGDSGGSVESISRRAGFPSRPHTCPNREAPYHLSPYKWRRAAGANHNSAGAAATIMLSQLIDDEVR